MYGISTAWKSDGLDDGLVLLKQMLNLEVPGLELEYRITSKMFEQMQKELRSQPVSVLSIHNFFPLPEVLPKSEASGDAFWLSSTDREERERAIRYTKRTIQIAHDLEAPAVVLHLGKVDIAPETEKLFYFYNEGKIDSSEAEEFIGEKLVERQNHQRKNLDAVLFSLDTLNREAIKLNILLGIENRCHYHEIPNFDEIGYILEKFEGGNICYWHDTGHAQVLENLGLLKHEELLKAYSPQMAGIHLHDCQGHDDHIAPGSGQVDFEMIKSYLSVKVIRVIEVHPVVTEEQLREGIEFLKQKDIIWKEEICLA